MRSQGNSTQSRRARTLPQSTFFGKVSEAVRPSTLPAPTLVDSFYLLVLRLPGPWYAEGALQVRLVPLPWGHNVNGLRYLRPSFNSISR